MPPAAKKPRASGGPKATGAQSTALVAVDPYAQVMIYLIVDRSTNKVIYVGQSIQMRQRWLQHVRKIHSHADCGIYEYCKRKQRSVADLEIKRVPELPDGVAQMDADRFEAYFISKYLTMHDMRINPDGCNMTAGNRAYKVDVDQLEKELAEGYKWPEPAKAQVAPLRAFPTKLKEARLQESVLSDLSELADPESDQQIEGLAEALGEARLVLGRMQGDGLLEHVRDALLPKYETMPPYATVLRSHVVAELNGVADRANDADEELGRAVRWEGKALLLDRWRVVPLTASEAVHKLRVVLGLVGRFAEARLDKTPTVLQNWLRVRRWCAEHGGRAPSCAATSRALKGNETFADQQAEASLGAVISTWKAEYDPRLATVTGRPYEADVRVLVRDFPTLLQAIRTKDEQAADSAALHDATIAFMKRGLADSAELRAFPAACAAEGLQAFTVRSTGLSKAETARLRTTPLAFMRGSAPTFAPALRAAADDATKLTHARVQRLVEHHESNVADWRERSQQLDAVRAQRKHAKAAAAGMPVNKKRARGPVSDSDSDDDE